MKKLNNKGFLLVETVIVSVFVLTIFVLIYQNSLPMIDEYNQRLRYDDVDTVYALDMFRRIVLGDENYDAFLEEVNDKGYKDMTNCNVFSLRQQETCNKLKEYLGIETDNLLFLTTWDVTKLSILNTLPRGYLEYVQYLKNQNQEQITEYRLIISRTFKYKTSVYDETDATEKEIEKKENHYANMGL